MPIYDYACASCGPFTALRPLARFDEPGTCPHCDSESPKVVVMPAIQGASVRQRSYDAVSRFPSQDTSRAPALRSARHGISCSCCKPSGIA